MYFQFIILENFYR